MSEDQATACIVLGMCATISALAAGILRECGLMHVGGSCVLVSMVLYFAALLVWWRAE